MFKARCRMPKSASARYAQSPPYALPSAVSSEAALSRAPVLQATALTLFRSPCRRRYSHAVREPNQHLKYRTNHHASNATINREPQKPSARKQRANPLLSYVRGMVPEVDTRAARALHATPPAPTRTHAVWVCSGREERRRLQNRGEDVACCSIRAKEIAGRLEARCQTTARPAVVVPAACFSSS